MKALGSARLLPVLLMAALFSPLGPIGAAQAATPQVMSVPLGGVKQIDTGLRLSSLSVGDPNVVEIITPTGMSGMLLAKGKRVGSTTLMVWGRTGQEVAYTINVGVDLDALSFSLIELFPEERISLHGTGETLVLRGTASSLESTHALTQWIEGYVASLGSAGSRLKILNLIEMPAAQQVQLEVRFAEISRTAARKMGVNLIAKNDGHIVGMFGALSDAPEIGAAKDLPTNLPSPISESVRLLFQSNPNAKIPFNALLSILSSRGLARTLSEPTLVALSGQKAEFLVGGELPVPIPLGLGQVSIEYKQFGVQLAFTPTVLRDNTIQLQVSATVSDLDYSKTLQLQGFEIPALTSRKSQTVVRMRTGQSFAIAGLLSDKVRSMVDRVPVLGDIPILGALFRSTQFQREETELIVVVSANLVEPLDSRNMPSLPGEHQIFDPNDFELFLMGWGDIQRPDPDQQSGRPAPTGRVGYR